MAAGLCFRCLWAGTLTDDEPSEGEEPERTRQRVADAIGWAWAGLMTGGYSQMSFRNFLRRSKWGVFPHTPTEHPGSGTGRAWPGCVSSLVWN